MCRLCGEAVESLTHIVSGCKMLAQKDYSKWYHHEPDKVVENDVVKILWDFNIPTDRIIEHHRPDITVVDKARRKCLIVDVAIPGDQNITKKEFEKINNYSELRVEIAKVWNMETEVVPVVIGALGSIPKNLHHHPRRCRNHRCLVQLISCERCFLSEAIDLIERTIYNNNSRNNIYCVKY